MSNSIWVVEQGRYSDYRVVGVFSTEANARAVASLVGRDASTMQWEQPTVSEWPLDPGVSELAQGYTPFSVWMLRDGTVENCESAFEVYGLTTGEKWLEDDRLHTVVWAKDDTHAIKIANEIRTRMIAENEWPEPHDPEVSPAA